MATIFLNESSSGAPTLSGTNGTLCTVLDWALVQNGWTVEYTASNQRVYRPGAGKRFRLYVAHDSTVSGAATLATIRGCESASAASIAGLVDPFPTVAQITNVSSTVLVSSVIGATARPYQIIVGTDFMVMTIGTTSANTTGWDIFAFGDWGSAAWDTGIWIGANNSTNTSTRAMSTPATQGPSASGKVFWCRTIDGSQKSAYGSFNMSSLTFGLVTNTPAMRGGYLNRIVREKVSVSDNGSNTVTTGALVMHKRGWLPFVWNPVHNNIGSVTSDDVFQDTAYSATTNFRVCPASTTVSVILELGDTWTVPSG